MKIAPEHDHVRNLCLDCNFKLETYKQYDEGTRIIDFDGKVVKYTSDIPTGLGLITLLDTFR